MASEDRAAADALIRSLHETPYGFSFFQAVRRLENVRPDLPRVGHSRRPSEDPLRFCQEPSLAFPPATIKEVRRGTLGGAPEMFVTFMGLLGPNGPLPLHLTEYARERVLAHDHTLARFFDVFNHRMVSLFYRAWAACNQAVNYERGDDDRYAVYVGSLFGIGMPSLRERDRVPDGAKFFYSGRLVCQTRHRDGLRALLEDYYRIPTRIAEFIGQWLPLPEAYRCRLGESPDTCSLGSTAIVGAHVWDCQQKYRIVFGPMPLVDYERMLPGETSHVRLVDWIRNYTGDELAADVQLILDAEEVPEIRLGSQGRLGWTTWLKSQPFERDADDLVLRPFAS
jgi:type VI secretion system protein ImpH